MHPASGPLDRSIAFSADSTRVAVGIGQVENVPGKWYVEQNDRVAVLDLTKEAREAEVARIRCPYHAEALAFDPKGRRLAVAGGPDHDVTLFDLAAGREVGSVRGVGTCLWSVGLSKDGRYVAYTRKLNNSDESELRVVEVGRAELADVIPGTKYAVASWTPDNKGFYYVWVPPVGGERFLSHLIGNSNGFVAPGVDGAFPGNPTAPQKTSGTQVTSR